MSRQLHQEALSHEVSSERRNLSLLKNPWSATTEGNHDQGIIPVDSEQASLCHEDDKGSRNLPLLRNSGTENTETNPFSLNERTTTINANDDINVLGRRLFEEDRKSRTSFITKLQEDIKEKERSREMNVSVEDREGSSNATYEDDEGSLEESSHEDSHHNGCGRNHSAVCVTGKDEGCEESDERNLLSRKLEITSNFKNSQSSDAKDSQYVPLMSAEVEKEEYCSNSSCANTEPEPSDRSSQRTTEEHQNDGMETGAKNFLAKPRVENAVSNEAPTVSQFQHDTNLCDPNVMHHHGLRKVLTETTQGDDLERVGVQTGPVEEREDYTTAKTDGKGKNSEVIPLGGRGISQTGISNERFGLETRAPKTSFHDEDDAPSDGPWDQFLSNFNGSEIDTGLCNSESVKTDEIQTNAKGKDERLQLIRTKGKDLHDKDWKETTFRSPFLGGDVVVDGDATDVLPPTNPDIVGCATLAPTIRLSCFPVEAGIGHQDVNVAKRDNSKNGVKREGEPTQKGSPMPFETRDVVDGPINPLKAGANLNCMSPDFGGARPKENFSKNTRNSAASTSRMYPTPTNQSEKGPIGLDPDFVARHAFTKSSLPSSFGCLNCNGAAWEDFPQGSCDEHYFSAKVCSNSGRTFNPKGSGRRFHESEAFPGGDNVQSLVFHQTPTFKQDESWHFPPLPTTTEVYVPPSHFPPSQFYDGQECPTQQTSTSQVRKPLFDLPVSQGAYNNMVSIMNEFNSRSRTYDGSTQHSAGNSQVNTVTVNEGQEDSAEDSTVSLLAYLEQTMTKTVKLFASSDKTRKSAKPEVQPVEKVGIQEQARGEGENELAEAERARNLGEQTAPNRGHGQTVDVVRGTQAMPVQETPRPACGHYQRRCLVKFPCCGRFYPCHRCHNDSKACSDDQARAINATHIRCTICYHEQVVRSLSNLSYTIL